MYKHITSMDQRILIQLLISEKTARQTTISLFYNHRTASIDCVSLPKISILLIFTNCIC